MDSTKKVQLKLAAILGVPIKSYSDDFTFIVNGEEFKTNRLISELLSPKICKIHLNDPTIDKFIINTESRGNFSQFLNLIDFSVNNIPENELPFICEICKELDNENIELCEYDQNVEITVDNIIYLIRKHEQNKYFYHQIFRKEVDFISANFSEIIDKNGEELCKLNENTILQIISNKKLQMINEDQLLKFVNQLYTNDPKFGYFYEFVLFENVSSEFIDEFLKIYDVYDITKPIWKSLSKRLRR